MKEDIQQIKAYEIYFSQIKYPKLIDLILYHLYKIDKYDLLYPIITLIEIIKYGLYHKEKLIDSLNIDIDDDLSLKTQNNKENKVLQIHRTKLFREYKLKLDNGYFLNAADNHIVYTKDGFKFIKNLTLEDYVKTDIGFSKVKKVSKTFKWKYMCDFSLDGDHTYYTNGIVSHNTTCTSAFFLWYMIFHNERNTFVVANKDSTAKEIVDKITEMLKGLPFFLKPGIIKKNDHNLKFDNGCYLHSAPTSKTPATGLTIHIMYIDEAALIPNNIIDDFWKSVFPTLSSSKVSKIILTSTPRGRQNLFYRIWDGAVKNINGFAHIKVHWWENPDHDEEWAKKEKIKFGEEAFAQEYDLQWDAASSKLIRGSDMKCMKDNHEQFKTLDLPTMPTDICPNFYWKTSVFDPLSSDNYYKHRFLLSLDTAEGKQEEVKGKDDADYNVIQMLDIKLRDPDDILKWAIDKKIDITDCFKFKQVGVYYDNNQDEEKMAKAAKYLVYNTLRNGCGDIDNVRILIEMNFNGKNWLNIFMNSQNWYDALVLKTYHTKPVPGQKQKKLFGFKTTTGGQHIGKAYFCEMGAQMITRGQLEVSQDDLDDNHSTIAELGAFDKTRKSPNSPFFTYEGVGCHDDLAYSILNVSRAIEIPEFKVWLQEWFDDITANPNLIDEPIEKIQKIAEILNKAMDDTDEPQQMSDQDFDKVYIENQKQRQYQNIIKNNSFINPRINRYPSRPSIKNPYLGNRNPYLNHKR